MKKFLLTILALGMPLGLAGELQQLHNQLNQNTEQTQAPVQNTSPNKQMTGRVLEPKNPGIDEIGIERTRCLTNCPAYTFIIKADGSFRYVGEYGVEHMGEYTGKVSVGRLNQILTFVNEALYMSFDDTYRSPFLDGPTVYTMVKRGDTTKVVENYANSGPATLWAIEQLIDSLLATAEWDAGGGNR